MFYLDEFHFPSLSHVIYLQCIFNAIAAMRLSVAHHMPPYTTTLSVSNHYSKAVEAGRIVDDQLLWFPRQFVHIALNRCTRALLVNQSCFPTIYLLYVITSWLKLIGPML